MFDKVGVYIPIQNKRELFISNFNGMTQHIDYRKNRPFFNLEQHDNSEYIANSFLEAIKHSHIDEAKVYISKNYLDKVDISELSEVFENEDKLCNKLIIRASFEKGPKNCKTNTFMVVDAKSSKTSIFHIYMLNEPDSFGKWKIYGIEQE